MTKTEAYEGAKRSRTGKLMLRAHLHGLMRRASAADRAKIAKVLADGEIFDAVHGEVCKRYRASFSGDGKILDFVKWLLQWFVEHADELIAIIAKIIPLFV